MKYVLGLDFGGSKLAAGLVDTTNGVIVKSARCETPPENVASSSFAAMMSLAKSLDASPHTVSGVGVCFDGPVEPDGHTPRRSMHVKGWEGFPLAGEIEKELHVPTVIGNDAAASALAEYRFGAGQGVDNLLYLTVSTGIGGGIILHGQLYTGEHAWAGEIGHMTLKPDGPKCPCGRRGCLEAMSSGLSVARAARERLKKSTSGRLVADYQTCLLKHVPRSAITAKHVAEAAAQGDALAMEVWNEAMMWLGVGIASAANILNPGRVVLGGGLTNSGKLLFGPVRRTVKSLAMDKTLKVVPAALRDNVGIMGAAALVF